LTDQLPAEVLLDSDLPADRTRALLQELRRVGVLPRARVAAPRRALGVAWLALVSLPLGAFLSGLGGKLAEDAYNGLKRLVRTVCGRDDEDGPPRPLVLRDTASGLRIVLDADLPGEAYRQLFELDLAQFPAGHVHYDHHTGRWRSDLTRTGDPP
jgi:hypothetical protein